MKNTITKYVCDNCRKDVSLPVDSLKTPGWMELISFEMNGVIHMNGSETKIDVKNKDFCSKECLMLFINREIGITPDMDNVVQQLENKEPFYPRRRYDMEPPQPPQDIKKKRLFFG